MEKTNETGKSISDKVQNIYDLEGNCFEYVAERNNLDDSATFVFRGGYCDKGRKASERLSDGGNALGNRSFRAVIYIK